MTRELTEEEFTRFKDAILYLLIDTYKINFKLSSKQCFTICKEILDLLKGYIEKGNAVVIGDFDNENLVGLLWLYKHNYFGEPRMHVNQIVVSSQFRGKGIGKQLMQIAEDYSKCAGIETLDLFVSEVNQGAIRMYETLGFKNERRYMKKKV